MSHRTITTLRPTTGGMNMRAWLPLAAIGCVGALRKWRKARRSRWILSSYNDRLLADVGLTRQQIGQDERADKSVRW